MAGHMRIPESFPSPADVAGRRVVVTGASRGLGSVIAAAFKAAGARVALVARDRAALEDVAARLGGGPDTLVIPADVSLDANEAVADQIVAAWGGLDVWIANAGVSPVVGGPLETAPEVWRHVLDVNLTGVFLGARAAARVMEAGGRIIVTGSVLAERPRKGLGAYSASKAGAVALVKSLALDLAPRGITVNAVNPGWFDSPLTEPWQAREDLTGSVLAHTAQQRWGRSEDLPGAYLFLASRAADFVTGAVITVDGGYACI
jgi:NAD(P)-dependent dehydrogenase (short-subunit alcohol dehydrogenase family)